MWGFIGTALATFVGFLGSIAVAYFTFLNNDRGHDIRMVEISLSILRGEGDRQMSLPARRYAIEAIQRFSGVEISTEDAREWAETGVTPFKPISVDWLSAFGDLTNPECLHLRGPDKLACLLRAAGN